MPKTKHTKKHPISEDRKLIEKDDETEYGLVTKTHGNCRFSVKLNMTNKEVLARVCGKFRHGSAKRNNYVNVGSIVLLGIRSYQDDVADIIQIYTPAEVRQLRKSGKLLLDENTTEITSTNTTTIQEDSFDFGEI